MVELLQDTLLLFEKQLLVVGTHVVGTRFSCHPHVGFCIFSTTYRPN